MRTKNLLLAILAIILILSLTINIFQWRDSNSFNHKIEMAESLFNLNFTESERDSMISGLTEAKQMYEKIHSYEIPNSLAPTAIFNPIPFGYMQEVQKKTNNYNIPKNLTLPENREELCFYTVSELSSLIKERKITATELTKIYLDRIKRYDKELKCVVTLLEERALQQAAIVDEEISNGNYKGILHGIPYGVKDMLALEGYPVTWGSPIYKDQIAENTATVIDKLDNAGAILVAKLSLGEFAMGDVWFGGKTRNPWNTERGSSGSSAGSASATAAGLVAFSIGSETWGSIISPSTICGVTGLRPTFGRVSRYGAMTLSWSMDKLGPICRSAQDCAIVLEAINGFDSKDPASQNIAFNYNAKKDIKTLRVGYFKELFEDSYHNKMNDSIALNELISLGIDLIPVELPKDIPADALSIILDAEAAAAFSDITLSNKDDMMVLQHARAWPNAFRMARFIPAVEYIQAQRIRQNLIDAFAEIFKSVDVIITTSFGGNQLLMTNLTGHPAILVPNGFNDENLPTSFTIIANWHNESDLVLLSEAYQQKTKFFREYPENFKVK